MSSSSTVWWEGAEKTRVLIAPGCGGNKPGELLKLRHPKSENGTCYLFSNGMLQELQWFKQSYGSWLLGDYISEDGSLYMATPVDPVFILLPIFDEARMKKGEDLGKFRQLDEILFVEGYPGYQQLLPVAEKCMDIVCQTQEVGSMKFYRLDNSKVLAWLSCKAYCLKRTLPELDKNYAAQDEKQTLVDAVSIVGEYLKTEPWLKLLYDHLGLEFVDPTMKETNMENLSTANEITRHPQIHYRCVYVKSVDKSSKFHIFCVPCYFSYQFYLLHFLRESKKETWKTDKASKGRDWIKEHKGYVFKGL
ncbi:PREDICTED: ribonuclease H2 subunit B isoform X2 [Camelina sativa]|uniref:Ribonuclease H2 subunit B n=1 Tax=Camelina sativa TaxID=90675 RepID=A0ABM1QJR5_CAMSA|nr:PREDICTED: ribonuclease H2 subunit B isoform X2 [Camelina sativa]